MARQWGPPAKRHQPPHRIAGRLPGAKALHPPLLGAGADRCGRHLPQCHAPRDGGARIGHRAAHVLRRRWRRAQSVGAAHLRGAVAVSAPGALQAHAAAGVAELRALPARARLRGAARIRRGHPVRLRQLAQRQCALPDRAGNQHRLQPAAARHAAAAHAGRPAARHAAAAHRGAAGLARLDGGQRRRHRRWLEHCCSHAAGTDPGERTAPAPGCIFCGADPATPS